MTDALALAFFALAACTLAVLAVKALRRSRAPKIDWKTKKRGVFPIYFHEDDRGRPGGP